MVQRFDLLINLDKDSNAASLAVSLKAKIRQGYGLDENGVVFPLNKAARYHFDICLENWGKKTANRKSYQEMIFDIAGLKFAGEEYYINMPDSTKGIASRFKRNHSIKPTDIVVGLNTGCGPVYPHKKWVPDNYSKLIVRLVKELDAKVVLFGSKSEMEYNADIIVGASKLKEKVKSNVIDVTGLTSILGLASLINVCDVLVTGDTAGMHIAIGLRRPVVALFGPTPAQEINLYGRGVKLVGEVDCINCYDQFPCDKKPNCMETISPDEVFKAVSSLVDR
jgi:heptosyltransferase-2